MVAAILVLLGYLVHVQPSSAQNEIKVTPNWNYTHFNQYCMSPWGRTPCRDIRICKPAVASIGIGGWPAVCGWVGDSTIPKVCCGLPLVLGGALIKKILEEKEMQSDCGLPTWIPKVSQTIIDYYKMLNKLPDVNTRDPSRFDPPLDNFTGYGYEAGVVRGLLLPLEFPWLVSIQEYGRHLCGGTLIDRTHVLTAAHCFGSRSQDLDPKHFVVNAGDIKMSQGFPIKVTKILLHANFTPGQYYDDIAILTLEKEIHPSIRPICLPSTELSRRNLESDSASMLEWRHRSFGGWTTSELKNVTNSPMVAYDECRRAYRKVAGSRLYRGITRDFICARVQKGRKNACQSDSGTPLMYKDENYYYPNESYIQRYVLVGINSFGFPCSTRGFPSVYTRVSSYKDWILQHTED